MWWVCRGGREGEGCDGYAEGGVKGKGVMGMQRGE